LIRKRNIRRCDQRNGGALRIAISNQPQGENMFKRIITTLVVAATPFAVNLNAHAQTQPTGAGFYGGLGAGIGRTDIDGSGIAAGSTDKKDGVWKLFGGYQFNRYIAAEGGYVDMGKASIAGPQGFASTDSNAWQVGAVGSIPLNLQFALTGKLGVARTATDGSGSVNGVAFTGSDHNTAPTYGLGMRYDISKAVGLRGEWERFRVSNAGFGGKSDADLFTLNALFKF